MPYVITERLSLGKNKFTKVWVFSIFNYSYAFSTALVKIVFHNFLPRQPFSKPPPFSLYCNPKTQLTKRMWSAQRTRNRQRINADPAQKANPQGKTKEHSTLCFDSKQTVALNITILALYNKILDSRKDICDDDKQWGLPLEVTCLWTERNLFLIVHMEL